MPDLGAWWILVVLCGMLLLIYICNKVDVPRCSIEEYNARRDKQKERIQQQKDRKISDMTVGEFRSEMEYQDSIDTRDLGSWGDAGG